MNLRQMKTNEIAVILSGLRSIWISEEIATIERLIELCEKELAARGLKLAEPNETGFNPLTQSGNL